MRNSSPQIFILDDEVDLNEMLALELNNRGYSPRIFLNPKSFLEYFVKEIPSVAIIDLRLPDIPGTEVIKIIRANNINMPPIIVITAFNDSPKHILYHLGVDSVIEKPFTLTTLIHTIERLIMPVENRIQMDIGKFNINEDLFYDLNLDCTDNILVGRGGFSFTSNKFYNIDRIIQFSFDIPKTEKQRIGGFGIIRWRILSDDLVNKYGVEFVNIDDTTRQDFLFWVEKNKSATFIPYKE